MSVPNPTARSEILLADDPAGRLDAVRRGLEEEGIPVRFVHGGQEVLRALREGSYPIVAVPEALEETHGERLLRKGARRGEALLPVLLREPDAGPAPTDLPPDTIVLPIDETAEIVSTLAAAYRQREVSRALDLIVGETEPIRQIKQIVRQIAPTKLNVLLTGESGTGKELVARAIHDLSPRRGGPFVAVNAGALPEGVLESELFGHEKGAFTGAHAARAGRFELANKGTLFLDEIGEMPANIQVKLLRVLEEARGRDAEHRGRRAARRGDERRPRERRRGGTVPARSLLPPQRDPHRHPAAAAAARRHPAPGRALRRRGRAGE
jgi:DNA-binding NtrC family response regulator